MSSWKTIALAAFISFFATNMLIVLSNLVRSRTQVAEANSAWADGTCEAEKSVFSSQSLKGELLVDESFYFRVIISPESRVRVLAGNIAPELVQGEWIEMPIAIENQAGVTSSIRLESKEFVDESLGKSRMRWLRVELLPNSPLTGESVEHRTLRMWSRDQGVRAAVISVDVGQGTQDLGFRNEILQSFLIK